jgi:hypothetical protein
MNYEFSILFQIELRNQNINQWGALKQRQDFMDEKKKPKKVYISKGIYCDKKSPLKQPL